MSEFFGLKPIDLIVIVGYFAVVIGIGFWASVKVKDDEDFFLGGRRFGKGLLVMHWLCTGTHSEMAVQVAGASARVGLGGIWYQWMWLFSTPFYWLIAPMIRRLRVITTGDFFRVRYGRSLELVYTLVALTFIILSIASLLRGAAAAIAGATGGAVPTNQCVVALSILFSSYVMAGGLLAAAYTDFLQGLMIIVLSVLLVPAGLNVLGGMSELQSALGPQMMSITAPAGAREGNVLFVTAMSLLGLTGIVAQPHVMTANGSGKTEAEARVGMTYGNFIKRFLTIAWAFTGLIAVVMFPEVIAGHVGKAAEHASEQLYGKAIQSLLGDGWRGLMIACLIAGVTSAETVMVVGSGLITRNLYVHVAPQAGERERLWAGRIASGGVLAAGIVAALLARSVNELFVTSVQVIGLLGPVFWLGVTWRRANPAAAWCSLAAGIVVWAANSLPANVAAGIPIFGELASCLSNLDRSLQILLVVAVQFGILIIVGLMTRPQPAAVLDPFFARLLTPVGREAEFALPAGEFDPSDNSALGLHTGPLDYRRAAPLGYRVLQKFGIEIPRMTWRDWGGFILAWGAVAGLIVLLAWLSTLGR